ncbi:uncharacterized protein [Diadema antillarum]|uniref:uncharacterized protein n=1 Tax=Diadema antillarum TaxID=105358 RepID=UPI003A86F464
MPADEGSALATEGMERVVNDVESEGQYGLKQSDFVDVRAVGKKPDAHPKPRVQFNVPPQADTPKPCRKRKHRLKQQIAVVVKDLENVISELSSVVVELRGVLVQIERVSTELDATVGRRGTKVNKIHYRNQPRMIASDSSQERLDSPELQRMSARMRRRISAKSRRSSALGSKLKSESESSLVADVHPRRELIGSNCSIGKACSEDGGHYGMGADESDYGTKSDLESLQRAHECESELDSQGNCSCTSSTRHTATSDADRLSSLGLYSDTEIVVSPELALRAEFLMRSPALSRLSSTSCSEVESGEFHANYNRDINTWTTYALVHIDAPSNSDTWDSDREVCV